MGIALMPYISITSLIQAKSLIKTEIVKNKIIVPKWSSNVKPHVTKPRMNIVSVLPEMS